MSADMLESFAFAILSSLEYVSSDMEKFFRSFGLCDFAAIFLAYAIHTFSTRFFFESISDLPENNSCDYIIRVYSLPQMSATPLPKNKRGTLKKRIPKIRINLSMDHSIHRKSKKAAFAERLSLSAWIENAAIEKMEVKP